MRSGPRSRLSSGAVSEVSVSLRGPLVEAEFLARSNRFVVHARLAGGEVVVAHLPDAGRLRELLLPGRRLWLRPASETARPVRKTGWSVALVSCHA